MRPDRDVLDIAYGHLQHALSPFLQDQVLEDKALFPFATLGRLAAHGPVFVAFTVYWFGLGKRHGCKQNDQYHRQYSPDIGAWARNIGVIAHAGLSGWDRIHGESDFTIESGVWPDSSCVT